MPDELTTPLCIDCRVPIRSLAEAKAHGCAESFVDDGDTFVIAHDVICSECGEHTQLLGLRFADGTTENTGTDCCGVKARFQ